MASLSVLLGVAIVLLGSSSYGQVDPFVITTWNFLNATQKAWEVLHDEGRPALDAIESGCTVCEEMQCDGTVGYGGSPDESGETTLDAMIMDGNSMNVGAVAALRRIKSAISVARKVLDHTKHSMLAGELATQFAVEMGFKEESLTTSESKEMWKSWQENQCQPNFWVDVSPDPSEQCGPYKPSRSGGAAHPNEITVIEDDDKQLPAGSVLTRGGPGNHDTIGMVAIDSNGHLAAGTSTNGARFKIAGRVGDSPIPGAGAYADSNVGGAAATGDGDVMLRFLPSYQAVESMRQGQPPAESARIAVQRIVERYKDFEGAVVAVNKDGVFGAACYGLKNPFPFTIASKGVGKAVTMTVDCIKEFSEATPQDDFH